MLIRLVVNNLFSFGSQREFTTIPNNRLKTLNHHKYEISDDLNILKLSSIYGANGAGKSNLIKSLDLFQHLIVGEEIPLYYKKSKFKFGNQKENSLQTFAIEFVQEGKPFYYGIQLADNVVATEELYISGLGTKEDFLIFERKTDSSGLTEIKFLEDFENDTKSQVLKSVLLEEFIMPNVPVLKLLSNRDNKFLIDVKKAFAWFSDTLQIITPDSKPRALAHTIDINSEFKNYAEDIMCSFNIGISSLNTEKKKIDDFFGKDNENDKDELIRELEKSPKKMLTLRSTRGDEIVVVKEGGEIWVKSLEIEHKTSNNKSATFALTEESDGTIRLLDFVPAFKGVISREKVFFIDEIERSIHPLLIKELIKKFSLDDNTKGQLIFTTHESNLLDQELFRQDEIWFAEKDKNGITDLYSLSDFKEHKTIDIRKGYLNGRYGSIPFLGNLTDLNWHKYDTDE
ncbi:MAG: AAA family ATPase [Bacteroidota bacterium]